MLSRIPKTKPRNIYLYIVMNELSTSVSGVSILQPLDEMLLTFSMRVSLKSHNVWRLGPPLYTTCIYDICWNRRRGGKFCPSLSGEASWKFTSRMMDSKLRPAGLIRIIKVCLYWIRVWFHLPRIKSLLLVTLSLLWLVEYDMVM